MPNFYFSVYMRSTQMSSTLQLVAHVKHSALYPVVSLFRGMSYCF